MLSFFKRLLAAIVMVTPVLALAACGPDSTARPGNSAATGAGGVTQVAMAIPSIPSVQTFVRRGWGQQPNWNFVAVRIEGDKLVLYGRRQSDGVYVQGDNLNDMAQRNFARTGTSADGTISYREVGGRAELRCRLTLSGGLACFSFPGGFNVEYNERVSS